MRDSTDDDDDSVDPTPGKPRDIQLPGLACAALLNSVKPKLITMYMALGKHLSYYAQITLVGNGTNVAGRTTVGEQTG